MSGILKVNGKYDLCITQCWFSGSGGHRISGHIYEIIDYYLILKEQYNVCILLMDGMTISTFRKIIEYKYNLMAEDIDGIISNVIFCLNPHIIICNNILIVDGYYGLSNFVVKSKNIFMFACPLDNSFSRSDNHYILQDYRIYKEGRNTIDYKKKINFGMIKIPKTIDNKILLYGTKNCRLIDNETYNSISLLNKDVIVISDNHYEDTDNINYITPPINNLFEMFDTYIYTPVSIKFDCSPRFIAECRYFEKNVIYYGINYDDIGLSVRINDIDNNFHSLFLNECDGIFNIIGDKIG